MPKTCARDRASNVGNFAYGDPSRHAVAGLAYTGQLHMLLLSQMTGHPSHHSIDRVRNTQHWAWVGACLAWKYTKDKVV
eukprot:350723-Chlamydomonas_euryale.AAC.3